MLADLLEHDPTGCQQKKTGQKPYIAPGALQISSGSKVETKGRPTWKHFECITKTQEVDLRELFNISNVNKLAGYVCLKKEDKARVDLLLGIVRPPGDTEVKCAEQDHSSSTFHSSGGKTSIIIQRYLDRYHDARSKKSWPEPERSLKAAKAQCDGDCSPEWCAWGMHIAVARSNWDDAVTLAEEAEQLHPDSPDVHMASALVALITDRLPISIKCLQSILQLDSEHPGAKALMQRVSTIDQAAQEGDRLYDVAEYSLASEKYKEALDVLGCVDDEGKGGYLRVGLLGRRAASFTKMKRFDLARDDCEAALCVQNHPWRLEIMDKLARCHIALGDPAAALQQTQAALKLDPRDKSILVIASTAEGMQIDVERSFDAWARKDWLGAKSALDRAIIECTGDYPLELRVFKVEVEIAMRNWEAAISAAENAAELHPNSPHGFVTLGLALMLSNRLSSCLAPLQSALGLDPEHPLAASTLRRAQEIGKIKEEGDQAFRSKKHHDAVHKYTEALKIIGSNEEDGGGGYLRADLLVNRATALQKIKKYSRALTDILNSLKLNPSSYEALRTHAQIRTNQGYYDEAITIYKKAQNTWVCGDEASAPDQAIAQELQCAEAALEASRSKDYYGILGVPKNATKAEIESAYKKESLRFRPDSGGNPDHFKLISEAHTALLSES
ncbi:hypothetical protein FRB95_008928 [Tulasnella sp. JGI-2019a]|nr:hypothetical protein FRB95_008928 [Tulasnella sp. JGI-2019a]